MKCQAPECKENAYARCSVHLFKFCPKHYMDHSFSCRHEPLRIDIAQELKYEQTACLNQKVAQIKNHIFGVANNLVLAINKCVKNILGSLHQQEIVVMNMIEMCKPESQITQILEIIPEGISGDQNLFQTLLNLEREFDIRDFKKKVKVIAKKFEVVKVHVPQVPLSMVNPVFEIVEKLDLKGRIAWCQNQKLVLLPDQLLSEIKITKGASLVFICIFY